MFKLLILLLTIPVLINAQYGDIKFKHLTIEDGLSQSTVNCIFQDSYGFLWIGTENGLNRFDGYNFKVYKQELSDSGSLSHSWIWDIYEDSRNYLWIATWEGLNRYDSGRDNFIRYMPVQNDPNSISGSRPTSIVEDKDGFLWIATWGGGINIYDYNKQKFTRMQYDPHSNNSLPSNHIRNIYYSSDNTIWAATWNGLAKIKKLSQEKFQITNYKHDPADPSSLNSDKVSFVVEGENETLWVGTFEGGLNLFDRKTKKFTHYLHNRYDDNSLSSNDVISILFDSQKQLWVGTVNEGLNLFISDKNGFMRFKHDPKNKSSLNGNNIFSIFEDNSGLIWVGTNGLNIYNPQKKPFKHFLSNTEDKNSINYNRVTSFFEDSDGILWIGTEGGGLNRYDPVSGRFSHYMHNRFDKHSLSNNNISSVVGDKSGHIWIGTRGGGLNRFNPRTGNFKIYTTNAALPETEGIRFINDMCYDKEGILWIATYDKGLIQYDIEKGIFHKFMAAPSIDSLLNSNYLLTLFADSRDGIWIGTWGSGLNYFNKHTGRFYRYVHDKNNAGSISGNIINSVNENNGILWVGTNIGISFMDLENSGPNNFYHILEKDGLPSNVICGILADESSNLWISSNAGLSKFNPREKMFKNFDIYDGLQSNEYIAGSCLRLKDGKLVFGGINGFNSFFPDSIKQREYIPKISLTSFKVFDKPISFSKSLNKIDIIELHHWQNFFSFEFTSLDYAQPVKNQYAYMLEGLEKDWHYSGTRRYASYTNLNPGEYFFRVKGTNSDGVWNEKGRYVKIVIRPPWWQTYWAYSLYIILFLALIYTVWRFLINRERLKQDLRMEHFAAEKLREVDVLKTRFFTNISHEFRTPLTLIMGPAKQISDEAEEIKIKDKANLIHRNAAKLNRLVAQLLDLSRIESGATKLQTNRLNIISLLKDLLLLFAPLAEKKKILLSLNVPEEPLYLYLDRDKVEKIFNNLLSNAFKFTAEGGKVTVALTRKPFLQSPLDSEAFISPLTKRDEGGCIQITISDTGIGIPEDRIAKIFDRFYQVDGSRTREHEGTGIGLALTKELVELHKGEIEVTSQEGEGTAFTIKFLLGKSHLRPEEICPGEKETENEDRNALAEDLTLEHASINKENNIKRVLEDVKPLLLIVEDNTDVRNYVKGFLKKEYKILEAADGVEGLNKSLDLIPDIVVSDVMMPGMDGFQLCEKLKTDERTSHIPIILLTAKAAHEDKIEGLETGADDYLKKPFDEHELKVRIKNLIEQRRRLHEHFRKETIFSPDDKNITSVDKKLLQKIVKVINEHISDSLFSVDVCADELAMGRTTLHKKVMALVGEPPSDLIKRIRLSKAGLLLKNKAGNISEIALEVGFNNPAYFSECFKKQFGLTPSQYQRDITNH